MTIIDSSREGAESAEKSALSSQVDVTRGARDNQKASTVPELIGSAVAGAVLRSAFFARLDMADSLGAAPNNRALRAKLVAADAALTRMQRVRIGIATGVYQLAARNPWTCVLAVVIALMWAGYAVYSIVEVM